MVSFRLGRALGARGLSTSCPLRARASCLHTRRAVHLAATRGSRRRMRPIDFCFPTTRLRALASRRLPCWSPDFHRTPHGGSCVSRRLRSASVGPSFSTAALKSVLFCFSARRAEPLTPLSPPPQMPVALSHARAVQGPPRSLPPHLREEERLSRPKVPSIVG